MNCHENPFESSSLRRFGQERRNYPRHQRRQLAIARFRHADGSPGWEAGTLCDVSRRGFGLLLRNPVPLGTILSIELLSQSGESVPFARVVRCVEAGNRWLHGCRFNATLAEGDLRGLLGEAVPVNG